MKKGVVFDLDGVILSTDEYHYLAWKKMADKEGIYFDRDIFGRLRGVSRMDCLEIVLEKAERTYSQEEKNSLAAWKNDLYRESLKEMDERSVSQDVLLTLRMLKESGIKIAIGSSSKNTKFILEKVGLIKTFDGIIDGNDVKKAKPDPEIFLKAASSIGLKPEDCYVVEDATAGIDAAKAGGFTAIGIGDAAKYVKSDIKIQKLSDILDLFK